MEIDLEQVAVSDNRAESRYQAEVQGKLAVIEYRMAGDTITLVHTGVPEALEGHGIAARLARFALDDARARGLSVIPSCPYVAAYIQRHRDYLDLVPPSHRVQLLGADGS